MIGFYFHFEYNKNDILKQCIIPYDSFIKLTEIEKNTLYLFESNSHTLLQKSQYTFYNIGTLIYKGEINKKALDLIYNDLLGKNIKEIVNEFSGEFCLIVNIKKTISIITDKLGMFPIYKIETNKSVQISNIFTILCKLNKVSLNFQALSEFMSLREDGYCIDSTFFNEIALINMSTIYEFNKKHSSFKYYDLFKDINLNSYKNFNEICEKTRNILSNNLKFLLNQDKIFIDLTGGMDTRLNATILKDLGIDYTIGICGEQNEGESKLAKDVAKELKMKMVDYFRIKTANQFRDTLDDHFNLINGVPFLYHTTELINYYKEIQREFNIHIGGFGGTELFTQYYRPLDIVSKKFNVNKFLSKYYKYSDIFQDEYISSNDYYYNLQKKIYRYFDKIGSNKFNDVATPLNFFIYSRYYHGSIIGTHNCILPYYSPYFESDFVKFMIEVDYHKKEYHNIQSKIITDLNKTISLIMTTNGYTANFGKFNRRDFLSKQKIYLKDISRRFIFHSNITTNTFEHLHLLLNSIKTQDVLEDSDRKFWNQYVMEQYSNDLEMFKIVNRKKFEDILKYHPSKNKYLAKIIYLEKLLKEFNFEI